MSDGFYGLIEQMVKEGRSNEKRRQIKMMEKELLTRKEVARHCGICTKMVDRIIGKGDLVIVRIGRSVRVHKTALEQYLNEHSERLA